ncbi:MAG: Transcriptional regulator, YafY family [Cytophagales bacterium]|jgi:predicted DNA-binding transcriptional regulator YafY|nr:YafY family transcriptional regulator [Bacteroidota bacterium]MBS1980774.1 YafY family transcriptional regulator [Bacteroidota bacterium]WHZ08114.1 MAG: Transcriptional regulator, YafY family [Cytophagales bacterium]
MNRIDRLTAILIHLQTKRIVKAEEIASRFRISLRTVYRDVKALMEAGVPIGSEAGKGYFIVDGFHLPPVMFTQDEANSMLLAGKLVDKMADKSVRTAFDSALYKIKAVLSDSEKDHLENLESHVGVFLRSRYEHREQTGFTNDFLSEIQRAIAQRKVLSMEYVNTDEKLTQRCIEPVGIFYYSMAWHVVAWCRLRDSFRNFRADRIKSLHTTGEHYEKRNAISLQEYFQTMFQSNQKLTRVVVTFEKSALRGKPLYGSLSQEDLGTRIRSEFMMDSLDYMAHWLLMFGPTVEIEQPEGLKIKMAEITGELFKHYLSNQPL